MTIEIKKKPLQIELSKKTYLTSPSHQMILQGLKAVGLQNMTRPLPLLQPSFETEILQIFGPLAFILNVYIVFSNKLLGPIITKA